MNLPSKNVPRGRKNSKNLKVIKWFNFGSYPGYWIFVQNFSYTETMRYLKRVKADEWVKALSDEPELFEGGWKAGRRDVEYIKTGDKQRYFFVIIPEGVDTKSGHDLVKLAHECVHICQFYLPDVLDRNKEHEAEAYLHSHLMTQVIEHLED